MEVASRGGPGCRGRLVLQRWGAHTAVVRLIRLVAAQMAGLLGPPPRAPGTPNQYMPAWVFLCKMVC